LTLVLRLNQETRASCLHVPSADHTRCHSTSRPPTHQVSDLCDHLRSSAPGLILLSRSSSLHAMPHLLPAHHKTSNHDSPNEIKVTKTKQNYPEFEFKPRQVNDSSQSNQGTDHLVSQRPRVAVLHRECTGHPNDGGNSSDRVGDVEAEEELWLGGAPTTTVASGGP
jgi:hypothetical protein